MRFFSILTALLVTVSLYMLVFERPTLLAFASGEDVADAGGPTAAEAETDARTGAGVGVVALASKSEPIEQVVLVRGRTEAARQVDVRAETGGAIMSEPLRKGAFVGTGDLLCRIDPGTRGVTLEETEARLAEAKSRVPEAEARLGEASAAVPAAEARILEAKARIPEAEARLAEAEAKVPEAEARLAEAKGRVPEAEARLREARAKLPEAEARLAEARARLPEAEARVSEAEAKVNEAEINLNAAEKLSEGGFASDTRVAAARAAMETARAGLQSAMTQFEGSKAGVQAAMAGVETANAGIQSAMSLVENAATGIETAKSLIESARAGVQAAKSQVESAATGVITATSQLESAKAGVQSARSGVEAAQSGIQSAEAAVASADKEIERLEILAPFAGLLESDTAELGSLMQPGSLCATIVQLDPIKLVGFVPETEVDNVELGAVAGARLATGRQTLGEVTFLSRSADPQTRTFRVEVQVPNADLTIRDGQTAEIAIQAAGRSAHLIPQSALTLNDEGVLGVRTIDAESRAGFAPVTVLRDTKDGIYVSGLPDAADIIVVGQEYVTEGVLVEPKFRNAGVLQ